MASQKTTPGRHSGPGRPTRFSGQSQASPETESQDEDMSEGGEGGEGDVEDNRDVFEKALDYATPAAAGYLGMVAGRRVLGGSKRALREEEAWAEKNRLMRNDVVEKNFKNPSPGDAEEALFRNNQFKWASDSADSKFFRRMVGGFGGGLTGAVAGVVKNDQYNKPRRRK